MSMTGTKRSSILLTALMLVVFATGCGKSQSEASTDSETPDNRTVEVSTTTAEVREVAVSMEANGTFEATESSDLAPPTEGLITATPVDIGAAVRPVTLSFGWTTEMPVFGSTRPGLWSIRLNLPCTRPNPE